MKTNYCIEFLDSSNNDMNNRWRCFIDWFGLDDIQASDNYEYPYTFEQAKEKLSELQTRAEENDFDWACFRMMKRSL